MITKCVVDSPSPWLRLCSIILLISTMQPKMKRVSEIEVITRKKMNPPLTLISIRKFLISFVCDRRYLASCKK